MDLAVKYSAKVDERFAEESKTSLVVNNDYDFVGAHSIAVYSVSTAPLNDYDRNPSAGGLSRYGTVKDLNATKTEFPMEKDKSFTFSIDKMDEDETLGALNAGSALAREISEVIIPEVDKYTYGKIIAGAGTSITETITSSNAYTSIVTANETLDESKYL